MYIGRLKNDKQAGEIHGRCIDSFKFFRIPPDETMANAYFLALFYCSRQLIHCFEISGNKKNLRLNRQKLNNSPA